MQKEFSGVHTTYFAVIDFATILGGALGLEIPLIADLPFTPVISLIYPPYLIIWILIWIVPQIPSPVFLVFAAIGAWANAALYAHTARKLAAWGTRIRK